MQYSRTCRLQMKGFYSLLPSLGRKLRGHSVGSGLSNPCPAAAFFLNPVLEG